MLTATCLENSTLPPERSTDRQRHNAPLGSKDGTTLIKDKVGILCRWKEHFTDLLDRDSHVEPDSIDNVHAVSAREELDDVIHIEEVRRALKNMKCNKASGGDGIPAEVYKHGGTTLVRHLHRIFMKIWKNEEVPQEETDASIVTKEGSCTECGNYRGISLLSVAGKILAKVLLNRLQHLSESINTVRFQTRTRHYGYDFLCPSGAGEMKGTMA